jgi:hypothetical protein
VGLSTDDWESRDFWGEGRNVIGGDESRGEEIRRKAVLWTCYLPVCMAWTSLSVSPAGKLAFSTLEASKHSGLDVRIIFNLTFKKAHYQRHRKVWFMLDFLTFQYLFPDPYARDPYFWARCHIIHAHRLRLLSSAMPCNHSVPLGTYFRNAPCPGQTLLYILKLNILLTLFLILRNRLLNPHLLCRSPTTVRRLRSCHRTGRTSTRATIRAARARITLLQSAS